MHVVSRRKLREFCSTHPAAWSALNAWYREARRARWASFHDVRAVFRHADVYKRFVIFNVGGNKYRLIAEVNYARHMVFVRDVLTHADYTRGNWKLE